MHRILAIMPVHNRRKKTLAMLECLRNVQKSNFLLDVLVIDDGSNDGTAEDIVNLFPEVILERGDGNLWWGGAINLGLRYALFHAYDYVYTLNDDIVLQEDTLVELYKVAIIKSGAVFGSVILQNDGRILAAGYSFSRTLRKQQNPFKNLPYESINQELLNCEGLSTQSVLIPMEVLQKGLLIDDSRFPHNYSDLEYFDRVHQAGFLLIVVRKSVIMADESSSNFHLFILNNGLKDICYSFWKIKYAHNFITQWNIATKNAGLMIGFFRFIYIMAPYFVWFALKMILPRRVLLDMLVNSGRVSSKIQNI